ncbi:hypothetical protein BZG36_04773 [Bifiguratus adelaidae]|uniref:Uncharacterized protein n=1 Tax=Bifiguratus adelaidae TaxID=1938954 RepID=A0A261XWP7_9FUNG|nr:hypothetical protein BZG36_04773 [Bifiguratus adelaidae]
MLGLNALMIHYKWIQSRLWYDGLAADVPEATVLGAIATMLVIILMMEIRRRGLFFGYGWKGRKPDGGYSMPALAAFAKRYHGYMISTAIVYNFHYHPAEGTMAHFLGFSYQFLLLWQSSLMYAPIHRQTD